MKQLDNKTLKYFADMAARSYINDPVYAYAAKSLTKRERFIYHFMLERLSTSNREGDIIYIDEKNRGICVWRDAHNEYTAGDFLLCPSWLFLAASAYNTAKALMAYDHLEAKVFEKNTLLISPVFVDPEYQGQGVATKLIQKGIDEFVPKGYKLGLEAQNPDNVLFYEKLGFSVIKHDYWKREKIHNYYMVYTGNK